MTKLYIKTFLLLVVAYIPYHFLKESGYEWGALWFITSANFFAGSMYKSGLVKLGK